MLTLTPQPDVVLCAVEVPVDAAFLVVVGSVLSWAAYDNEPSQAQLPPGSWQFIATTDTIEDNVGKTILPVEGNIGKFLYYRIGDITYFSPKSALLSLIQSAGGDPGNKWAILKQTI